MTTLSIILSSIACTVIGQVLLKAGMRRIGRVGRSHPPSWREGSRRLIQGAGFYILSAVTWLYVLSRVPLSYAFPFLSLTYVGVMFAARWKFQEAMSPTRVVGGAIIVLGVVLVGLS